LDDRLTPAQHRQQRQWRVVLQIDICQRERGLGAAGLRNRHIGLGHRGKVGHPVAHHGHMFAATAQCPDDLPRFHRCEPAEQRPLTHHPGPLRTRILQQFVTRDDTARANVFGVGGTHPLLGQALQSIGG